MTLQIAALFAVLGAMVYLFLTEKLPVDLTAFLGLIVLVFAGYVTPAEAFQGFSSPAVITMLSVFILGAALLETGVADSIAGRIHRLVGDIKNDLLIAPQWSSPKTKIIQMVEQRLNQEGKYQGKLV